MIYFICGIIALLLIAAIIVSIGFIIVGWACKDIVKDVWDGLSDGS
jgi:hypothetical protein